MGTTNVGDKPTGGLGCLSKSLDIARMTGSHLDYCYLMVFVKTEQSLGHTDIIVEVALSVEHVELLRENGGNKLFCGGLAVGAGYADNGNIELAAMLASKIFESLERIINFDDTFF